MLSLDTKRMPPITTVSRTAPFTPRETQRYIVLYGTPFPRRPLVNSGEWHACSKVISVSFEAIISFAPGDSEINTFHSLVTLLRICQCNRVSRCFPKSLNIPVFCKMASEIYLLLPALLGDGG